MSRLINRGKILFDNFAAFGGTNFLDNKRGKNSGVKGIDLRVRVIVACRGCKEGRDNKPCTIQTLTKNR